MANQFCDHSLLNLHSTSLEKLTPAQTTVSCKGITTFVPPRASIRSDSPALIAANVYKYRLISPSMTHRYAAGMTVHLRNSTDTNVNASKMDRTFAPITQPNASRKRRIPALERPEHQQVWPHTSAPPQPPSMQARLTAHIYIFMRYRAGISAHSVSKVKSHENWNEQGCPRVRI